MVSIIYLKTSQKQIRIKFIRNNIIRNNNINNNKNRYKIMNKGEFVKHIANKNSITQDEATKMIDMFTSSVTSALSEGNEVSLVGFGNFSVSKVAARPGRNPSTGETIQIAAYNQPKFKVGQKLKDAVNGK